MSIRDRLRLVFRREPASSPDGSDPAPYHSIPEIEFVAYAEDCRLFGHTRLDSARLTDMLDAHTEIELIDVAMEALVDGRIVEVPSMIVARDDLLVVQATGPRGARERRRRTRPHPVAVQTGPYLVRGQLHAPPTADPFAGLRRRSPMVPLTEGSIAYTVGDQTLIRRSDAIIVNRMVMDWIVPATEEDVRVPQLPAAKGILVKDFTGAIYHLEREREIEPPEAVPVEPEVPPAATDQPDAVTDEAADAAPRERRTDPAATRSRPHTRRAAPDAMRKAG
jgi:hypothetical protein